MKIVAIVLCLPMLAYANFEACSAFVEFPEPGLTGYRSYRYEPGCTGATLTCQAEFPTNQQLAGRSWFLTNNREPHGYFYPSLFLQLFRVECPVDTFLHLIPQQLQTERRTNPGVECPTEDFVQVRHRDLEDGSDIFCGSNDDLAESELYNGGLGRILSNDEENGTTVEFCSNDNMDNGVLAENRRQLVMNTSFNGFVVRATCVDPQASYLPGCVDFDFIKAWDQEWLDLQDPPYEKPTRLSIPHKRSAEKKMRKHLERDKRMEKRFKKFVAFQTFEFSAGQTVTYANGKLTFEFNNGSLPFCPAGRFFCLFAHSAFFGSRRFYGDAPFVFTGPASDITYQLRDSFTMHKGKLELDNGIAQLFYTVDTTDTGLVQSLLVPGDEVMGLVNRIYRYIYNCWVFPYPVVDTPITPGFRPFTLPPSKDVDIRLAQQRPPNSVPFGQIEATRYLDFLQEDFWPITANPGSCYRGTLIRSAPVFGSTIPIRLYEFCGLFYNSCNPILRIACQELLRLK